MSDARKQTARLKKIEQTRTPKPKASRGALPSDRKPVPAWAQSLYCIVIFALIAFYVNKLQSDSKVDGLLKSALTHFDAGEYGRTVVELSDVIATNPTYARAYYYRGMACAQLGDNVAARRNLDKAEQLGMDKKPLSIARAALECNTANHADAISYSSHSLSIEPNSELMYLLRGMSKVHYASYNSAIQDLTKCLGSKDNQIVARALQERAFAFARQNKFKEAIADYDQAIELSSHTAALYVCRGKCKSAIKDQQAAEEDFQIARTLDPTLKDLDKK